MSGKTGVRSHSIGTTIDITTRASRTSRHRKSTAASMCNFIAFGKTRSTNFGSSIPNDLFVDDHKHLPFPTRSGSIDRSHPNKPRAEPIRKSQSHKQKCLKGIDTFRSPPRKMSAELGFFSVLLVARHHVGTLDTWKRNCAVDLLCIPPRHSER